MSTQIWAAITDAGRTVEFSCVVCGKIRPLGKPSVICFADNRFSCRSADMWRIWLLF